MKIPVQIISIKWSLLALLNFAFLGLVAQSPSLTLNVEGAIERSLKVETSENNTIVPLSLDPISAIAVSGSVHLNGTNSWVRIILVDENFVEYLVYEVNGLLVNSFDHSFINASEETQSLQGIKADHFRIELQNASVELSNAHYLSESSKILRRADNDSLKIQQVQEKAAKINDYIKSEGLKWKAGITPVALLTYEQKKSLFQGTVPNLQGAEYYAGGIFVLDSLSDSLVNTVFEAPVEESPYVDSFDWRNRHGQHWLTSVKDQKYCGSCWAFSATATTEHLVNLYYNRQLDLDLSEQDLVSCSGAGSCRGGFPYKVVNYIQNNGIVSEQCFPYATSDLPCSAKCPAPDEKITFSKQSNFIRKSEDALKKLIIEGPVTSGVFSWHHAMSLVGYKRIKEGDEIFLGPKDSITISPGDPLIGKTMWIFKNSWGEHWGENGYLNLVTDIDNINFTYGMGGTVTSLNYTDADIQCTDNDNDGYYFWGIGPKPAHCPPCPDKPDGDDSDPDLGPVDQFGYCITLGKDSTTSNPVQGVCQKESPNPNAENWILRNNWSDNYSGSAVSNEEGALKVKHRAYGEKMVWIINNQELTVEAGKTYEVSFEFKDFEKYPANGVEVGLSSGIKWNGPLLLEPSIPVEHDYSLGEYNKKTVRFTANYSSSCNLAIKILWMGQPTTEITNYIKNLSFCEINNSQVGSDWGVITATSNSAGNFEVSPNPAKDLINIEVDAGSVDNIDVYTLEGVKVNTVLKEGVSGYYIDVSSLKNGLYSVVVKTKGSVRRGKFVKI